MTQFRELTRADILPLDQYERERRAHRQRITALKQNRRVEVGPLATFYFENFDTMWHQVHEMLAVERGGEAQIADELAAYNPLIPKGDELIATVMFEIDDPVLRARVLGQLGGVERRMYVSVAGEKIVGNADPTRENTSPEGKASSVQFMRFRFNQAQKEKFRAPGTRVEVGIEHPNYHHIAVLNDAARQTLAADLA
ncbi:MAG: DUF3501 family protein [Alphaproteobacteria bacterium]|nr:DUF3501 family protein [Alphaproteobacteria bacterium]